MAKQSINVGTTANDKKGDSLRAAFQKVNANFTELYTALGLDTAPLNLGAFEFTGSTLSTTDSSSIIIDQATTITSNLSVGGDILPQTANGGDLGSSTLPWRSLYVSNNTIYIGGTAVGIDANGSLTVNSSPVTGGGGSTLVNGDWEVSLTNGGILRLDDTNAEQNHVKFTAIQNPEYAGSTYGILLDVDNQAGWTFLNNGKLQLPASGIITTEDDEFFKLQAKDTNSALRNEIKLDPNNGTFMSVWGTEQNPSYSASSWATASWQNNGGQGYVLITDAEDLAEFWTAGAGSFVSGIEVSINGGARTSVTYYGDNEEQYDVELSVGAVPVSSPTTITSLTFYYRAKSIINIDYDAGEMLLNAQQMPIKLKTDNNINLESGGNLNIRGLSLTQPVRIYANNNTRIWEFGTDGSLTLPREGKIYGIGDGAAGDRYGYISWDGNSSGDGLGYNTMRLVPDLQGLEDAHTYIILDPAYVDGETGSIHIRAGGTRDNSLANLCLGGANSHIKIGAGSNPPVTVKANSNSWTFGTNGTLTLPGDIRSEGNINIDINLADSTLRRWQFGEDGLLTFPDGTNYSGNDITVPSGGIPTSVSDIISNGGFNSIPYTGLATTGGSGTGLTVNADGPGNGYITSITINNPGTGYTDGDVITITGAADLTTTFTISTSHTWTLGTTGRTTFPNGTVPEHSYGAAGDKEGMVVFTDPYIYYCKQDYVDNSTDIWVRVAWTGTNW
jgi:hypothetical protein